MPLGHSLLDHDPRALRDENIVRQAMDDDRALALLDDVREHRERRRAEIVVVHEDVDVRTLAPCGVHPRVDRLLHVRAVKVHGRGLHLHKRAREAEDVPQDWILAQNARQDGA